MQIVIEIDEDIAQGIIDGKEEASRNIVRSFQATIADAIKNGTPLPKGHGRIIDESKINKVYVYTDEAIANNIKAISTIITGTDAPTIIGKEQK